MKGLGGLLKSATSGDSAYKKAMRTKTSPADVISWSGSKDDQTSADATIASQATGAMSWAFITAVKQNPNQTYLQLLNSIRDVLASKYTQKPQLSCSHPLGRFPDTTPVPGKARIANLVCQMSRTCDSSCEDLITSRWLYFAGTDAGISGGEAQLVFLVALVGGLGRGG